MRASFFHPLWAICLILALALGARAAVDQRLTSALPIVLSPIPKTLGDWTSTDLEMDADIKKMLDPDLLIWRSYQRPNGPPVFLYGVFYTFQGAGKTMHSPLNCYPGGGWVVSGHQKVALAGKDHPENRIVASRIEISRNGFRYLLYYWYYAAGQTAAGQFSNKLKTLAGAVLKRRNDGGLITVSAALGKNEKSKKILESEFLPQLLDWLAVRPVFGTRIKEGAKSEG